MITLKRSKQIKTIPSGFSWKSLFFGCLYPLFNGDGMGFIIQFILLCCTFGFSFLITPFHYNSNRLDRLLGNGWEVVE